MVDWEEKISLREKRYVTERLMREKRSEEMQVLEEVFDKPTLMIIYRMLNSGILKKIFGTVKAGKEARIYWGEDSNGKDIAIKIFLVGTSEFRKGMLKYIEGDNRFEKIPRSTRPLIYLWARKEFRNLSLANKVRVRAPMPIDVKGNVLLMEFIGNKGIPAPLLKDAVLKKPTRLYRKVITYLIALYTKAHLIHGDLSEYNIMVLRGRPVLIDFSQGVNVDHPLAYELLKRDIGNLNKFFERLNVEIEPFESIYRSIIKKNGECS